MLFINLVVVYFGLIPRFVPACSKNETALSLLNCFSGGIFLAMALIHMAPEGQHLYEAWAVAEKIDDPFPLFFVTLFFGYVLILMVDKVIGSRYRKRYEEETAQRQEQANAITER